jgi:hypothetical protein
MTGNSCTFIIVPDATSQCRRYSIPKSVLYVIAVIGFVGAIITGVVLYTLCSEYGTIAMKINQLERLKTISASQRSMIDRYEQDIAQLGQHLAHIKQLNSRLMVLSGLDPAKSSHNNMGIGGSEEAEAELEIQKSDKGAAK